MGLAKGQNFSKIHNLEAGLRNRMVKFQKMYEQLGKRRTKRKGEKEKVRKGRNLTPMEYLF